VDTASLIAVDTRTHLEVSFRNPFDDYGDEFDRAAGKHFKSSRQPTPTRCSRTASCSAATTR